ncbi:MAG: hypothetical protein ABL908_02905 [Hyphomicrobium sp.]
MILPGEIGKTLGKLNERGAGHQIERLFMIPKQRGDALMAILL